MTDTNGNANTQTQSQKIATNFVMDKLSSAGIEVVTDKKEFDKLLSGTEKLQKMQKDLSLFTSMEKELETLKIENAWLSFCTNVKEFERFITDDVCELFNKKIKKTNTMLVHLKEKDSIELQLKTINEIESLCIVKAGQYQNVDGSELSELGKVVWTDFTVESSKKQYSQMLRNIIYNDIKQQIKKQKQENANIKNTILINRSVVDLTKEEAETLKKNILSFPYVKINGVNFYQDRFVPGKKDEFLQELAQANILVDQKHEVYLLPPYFSTGKNADALVDNEFLDLKRITGKNYQVGNRFVEGKLQATDVFVRILSDINAEEAMTSITNQLDNNNVKKDKLEGRLIVMLDRTNQYFEMYIKKDGSINLIPISPMKRSRLLNEVSPSDNTISQSENLSSENTPQKLTQNNITYGFAYNGKIYLDPDIMNSNTPIHEYTHLWDAYAQKTNPELWEKGKNVFSQTQIWKDVKNDKNYADIASDDNLVLSEVHARICGDMAQKILERIADEDGEIARDKVVDWDREVQEYIAKELSEDFPVPELGSATYEYDSAKQKYIQDFFAQPMKDLMSGIQILRENDLKKSEIETTDPVVNFELEKIQEAGIKVNLENGNVKETLTWLNEVNIALEMLDEEPMPIQLSENEKSVPGTTEGSLRRTLPDNIIKLENRQDEVTEKLKELKNKCDKEQYDAKKFLTLLQKELFSNDDITKSGYFINNIDSNWYKFRLSNHRAIISDNQSEKTLEESVVIKFCDNNGRAKGKARLIEFTYLPENFTKEKQMEILQGIQDWIKTGEFSGQNYDSCFISNAEMLRRIAKEIQQHAEPIEQNNITNKKENTMENTTNVIIEKIRNAGLEVSTDRDEFLRVKKFLEESKEPAEYWRVKTAVAGIAMALSLVTTALPAYAKDTGPMD